MAELNVKTTVTGPDEIIVPLVRADYLAISNVFRIFFEIFLAVSTSLIGAILNVQNPTMLYWVFLAVTGVSCITFMILSVIYHPKSQTQGTNEDNSKDKEHPE